MTTALHVMVKVNGVWTDAFVRMDPATGGGFVIKVAATATGLRLPVVAPPIETCYDASGALPTIEYMDINGNVGASATSY